MKYYLGIDIGTFESKAVLVDAEGNIVAQAAHPHKMQVPQPGWAEHDAEQDWWGDFKRLSQQVISESKVDPRGIRAVGASAIGPCMLPVDADGNALMNGVLYGVDTRAHKEIAELTEQFGEDTLLRDTGNVLTSQSVGPKIKWLLNNRPDLYEKTYKFITSTTFITHRLTGRYVIDHYSAASWNPLYVLSDANWSEQYAKGITSLDRLAEIAWSTDVAGYVSKRASEETGLAVGTPVITGTIDAASEAVSVGVQAPGDMMLMYGSTVFIIMVVNKRVDDARLWAAPWLFPGEHASMAGQMTSGTLTHWFRDTFAKEFVDRTAGTIALAEEAAVSPPGANGVITLPYFAGERTPIHDPHAKGVIFGLHLTHQRSDVYRSMLEGIAYGTRHIIETFKAAGQPPLRIEAVGGGTKNDVWSQATSDIAGVNQNVREKTIGASYGDAFLAAVGVGDAKRGDITQWNTPDRVITPRAELNPIYDKGYRMFRDLYERNRDLMLDTGQLRASH
jgi:xylulokinase